MNKYCYKGQIITASSKEEAIQKIVKGDTISFEQYKKDFDAYWVPKIEAFKKKADTLKYIAYSVWFTDCDEDVDKFAEYAYSYWDDVKKAPISLDWWIYSKDKSIVRNFKGVIENLVDEEVYDDPSDYSYFWRDDAIDFENDFNKMKKANDLIATYIRLRDN